MKSNRFFTVAYDARNTSEMRYVRKRCGGLIAFGRWMALLGILYEQDGGIDLADPVMFDVVKDELEIERDEELVELVDALAAVKWVDAAMWGESRHVISGSVCDQIEFRKSRASAGRKGGESTGAKHGDGKPAKR